MYGWVEEWQGVVMQQHHLLLLKFDHHFRFLCWLVWYPSPVTSKASGYFEMYIQKPRNDGLQSGPRASSGAYSARMHDKRALCWEVQKWWKTPLPGKWWWLRWKGWRLAPVLADKDTSVRILCVRPRPNGSASECVSFQPLHSPTLLSARWQELAESIYWYGMLK